MNANPASTSPNTARSINAVLALTKSRSMLRTGQELLHYYQTCPLAELSAALETFARTAKISSLETAGAFIIAVSALTKRDTPAAVRIVSRLRGDAFVPAALVLLNDWMLRDKNAALSWFHGLTDVKAKGQMLTAATIFYGASNPQLIEEIRNGSTVSEHVLDEANNQALEALAISDPETALTKMDQITDPDLRRRLGKNALMVLAGKDPAKALGMMSLDAGPENQKVDDASAARVLALYFERDPSAAKKWISARDPALVARLWAADPSLGQAAARAP